MQKRRPSGGIPGDHHASSAELVEQAAETLLSMTTVDEIHQVQDKLNRVIERENAEGDNVLSFRHRG